MPRQRRSPLALRLAAVGVLCATPLASLWAFATPWASAKVASASIGLKAIPFNAARQPVLGLGGLLLGSFASPEKGAVFRQAAEEAAAGQAEVATTEASNGMGLDIPLILYLAFWFAGNYYYNITNKLALKAAGGAAGFPMTIATLQLGVGCIYALFLWAAPDARERPTITFLDFLKTLPVGFMAAGAHAASVFAMSAGAVSFGQIVKAAEPAFAALLGTLFYGANISKARWLCLIPVIGGVVLASLGELGFAWSALLTAAVANVFAAIRSNENSKLMATPGLNERMGSVGNQFAITMLNSFFFCSVLMWFTEGHKLGAFYQLVTSGGAGAAILSNLVYSGMWFYFYNELATLTIKKTGAVAQSVANTAKRAVVILGVAMVLGESLDPMKLAGSFVCIGGVFLYSVIDRFVNK